MDISDPRRKNLIARPRADDTTEELAASVTAVKLPILIDKTVRSLPNRSAWLRRVITEAAQRELLTCAERSALSAAEGSRSKDGES